MNSSIILFFWSMILGIMVSLCSNSMIMVWVGLEISLLSFFPILTMNSLLNSESSMKYFIVQGVSSSLLLLGLMVMILDFNLIGNLILSVSLMIKIGVAPFHNWIFSVVEGLNFMCLYIMLFIMKFVPIFICSLLDMQFSVLSFITMIVGSISGLIQNSIRKLFSSSSIYNLGLIVSCINENHVWIIYLTIYGLMLISLFSILMNMNSNYINQLIMTEFDLSKKLIFWLLILSMGGLPPFIGFLNKLIVIEVLLKSNLILAINLILTTLLVIYYYIRLTFISFMFFSCNLKFNLTKVSNASILSAILNVMLFPFLLFIKGLI
nr:NADH dehydrogenase subunit 2 [Subulatus sp.]